MSVEFLYWCEHIELSVDGGGELQTQKWPGKLHVSSYIHTVHNTSTVLYWTLLSETDDHCGNPYINQNIYIYKSLVQWV